MKLSEVKEILRAQIIWGENLLEKEIVAGSASDLMSDMLTGPTSGALLLTGLTNIQVIRTSVISGVVAVVFVRGKRPTPEMVTFAQGHSLPLLSTPFTMYSSCGRLFTRGLRGIEQNSSTVPAASP
jgi:predicted transcriptional regulator